jgi:hypothetical protein
MLLLVNVHVTWYIVLLEFVPAVLIMWKLDLGKIYIEEQDYAMSKCTDITAIRKDLKSIKYKLSIT